jgi:hypothetical protein
MLESLERLLWEKWDPMGVNDEEDTMGEYDSYASIILAMLIEDKTPSDVLTYLEWVETEYLGLGLSGKSPRTVERIFAMHDSMK